jgi:hypothetical protein
MLQHVVRTGGGALSGPAGVFRRLPALLDTIRLQKVYLNAQDVFSLCATMNNADSLKLMQDPDFVRGLKGGFDRSDQSVLSPFQVNIVNDTFTRAGLRVMPKDIVVPDDEQASPEAIINALQGMIATKTRDDRKITKMARMIKGEMLEDFAPPQLVAAVRALSFLQCSDSATMSALGKRFLEVHDDVSTLDLCQMTHSLCATRGILPAVLFQLFEVVGQRCEDFRAEDLALALQGIIAAGARYKSALPPLVLQGLEKVETLDANVLGFFLGAFTVCQYKDLTHVEIMADALAERAHELTELQLVMTLNALEELGVLSPQLFDVFAERALPRCPRMDVRQIAPMIDICSRVNAAQSEHVDGLMAALMDRASEASILFSSNMLGDILDAVALYPPAKGHPMTASLGRQVKRRMEGMGPPPLAKAIYGLASLGFEDPDVYVDAALVQLRWGFKDYTVLEPILLGLVGCGFTDPQVVKMLASHIPTMARQMTMEQVVRCNGHLNRMQCEEEKAYRALADRVKVFVREVTADVPEDIQALLERAAASQAEYEAQREARRAARGNRYHQR